LTAQSPDQTDRPIAATGHQLHLTACAASTAPAMAVVLVLVLDVLL